MSPESSVKPLETKLGLKSGQKTLFRNFPIDYFDLFTQLPEVEFSNNFSEGVHDFIHVFYDDAEIMIGEGKKCMNSLKKSGILWVSWPKAASKIKTNLKRDQIREFYLGLGLVDVKVASINEHWSALKFVYRLKDR